MRLALPVVSALLVSALLLAACAAPEGIEGDGGAATPALPDGVTVSVYQSRSDVAERHLKVSLTNDGASALFVTAVRFSAPQFTETAVWRKKGTTVRPGTTVDLPVALAAPYCAAADGPPTVTVGFRDAGGGDRTATVRPEDPFHRLSALRAEDCLAETVAAVAAISVSGPVTVAVPGGIRTATLDIVVRPAGGDGWFSIDSVSGTTLLAPADPGTGGRLTEAAVGRRVDAAEDAAEDAAQLSIPLTFVPSRCDAHAIAEDKRGTILPLRVTTADGITGIVPVAADGAVRSALYAFVAEACGLS
jgi:hypothetical protein